MALSCELPVLVIAGGLGKRKRELRDTQNNVEEEMTISMIKDALVLL